MRIASFEKPAIEKLITPASTPRTTDAPRLNLDPFDAKGLGVTSSRPSSPMLPRQKSRTHLHRDS